MYSRALISQAKYQKCLRVQSLCEAPKEQSWEHSPRASATAAGPSVHEEGIPRPEVPTSAAGSPLGVLVRGSSFQRVPSATRFYYPTWVTAGAIAQRAFLSLVRLNPAYAIDGSWWCRGQERGALSTLYPYGSVAPNHVAARGSASSPEGVLRLHFPLLLDPT